MKKILTTLSLIGLFATSVIQAKPQEGLTFVKEYTTFAKNFQKTRGDVASIDVSTCHLLEISNYNDKKERTAFSLTHFTSFNLLYPKMVEESIEIILNEFKKKGGDIKSAKIYIRGGTSDKYKRTKQRNTIKNAIKLMCEDCIIREPKGHYSSASSYQESLVGGIWDYMFTKKTTTWRLAVEMKDPSKDIYSKKLKTKRKKENWSKKIDKFHRRVYKKLDKQSSRLYKIAQKRKYLLDNSLDMFTKSQQNEIESFFKIFVVGKNSIIDDDIIERLEKSNLEIKSNLIMISKDL